MATSADLFHARVPRYTSYPTAPHFHAGITGETVRGWLRNLPDGMPLSLYLHIPFCDTLCWFCGCHTKVVNHYSPVGSYLEYLFTEIANAAAVVGRAHRVTHIHWGGGSPTMLSPEDVKKLAGHIGAHFEIAPHAEFAVEIDPRGLKDEMVEALAAAGLTRASIGVQDCDDKVQRAINRIQPFEVTRSAVERLRAAGIHALNIDLIYGLPYQTLAHVERTIEMSLGLAPQRFAVFGYAHVPHFKKHMQLIPEEALPNAEERLAQFELAHRILSGSGYVPIGLDHFARPDDPLALAAAAGTLSRNFQGYTTDDAPALIGLGASSISALPQGYAQNKTEVPDYRKAVEAGELPVARGIALSDDDRLRRAIIERLMCDLGVDLDRVAQPYGKSAADFAAELAALKPLIAQGFATFAGGRLVVPAEARAAVRLVAAAFDTYLAKSTAVHAVAV
ncbi:MAG: oxygen-independent coproporphyrinogen III oxidase [Alphaproteobacteria bacterium]|nr:oxygen-independent coproporphyrinogen III oxidase [Alphaproteobacteria bacterium]